MAAVLLFWDTNMAAVTSCENTLYSGHINVKVKPNENTGLPRQLRAMAEQEEKRNAEKVNESDE